MNQFNITLQKWHMTIGVSRRTILKIWQAELRIRVHYTFMTCKFIVSDDSRRIYGPFSVYELTKTNNWTSLTWRGRLIVNLP